MNEIYQLRTALTFLEGQMYEESRIERKWAAREAEARMHKEKAREVRRAMSARAQAILSLIYERD